MNFGRGLFNWKLKVLVPFLRVKSDRRATTSPHSHFFPNTSEINLKIAILLEIVQESYKKILVLKQPSRARGRALQVIPWGHIWFLLKECSYKVQRGLIPLEIESYSSLFKSKKRSEGN
jgi:hypothetical protein